MKAAGPAACVFAAEATLLRTSFGQISAGLVLDRFDSSDVGGDWFAAGVDCARKPLVRNVAGEQFDPALEQQLYVYMGMLRVMFDQNGAELIGVGGVDARPDEAAEASEDPFGGALPLVAGGILDVDGGCSGEVGVSRGELLMNGCRLWLDRDCDGVVDERRLLDCVLVGFGSARPIDTNQAAAEAVECRQSS